jgi:hypothetical protein
VDTALITGKNRESGLDEKKRDYLPADKQFLVTRNGKKEKDDCCHMY